METSEYIKKIIWFNTDKNVIKIKEKYNEASLLRLSPRKEAKPLTALS